MSDEAWGQLAVASAVMVTAGAGMLWGVQAAGGVLFAFGAILFVTLVVSA